MAASPLHGEVRSGLPHSLDPPSVHRAVVGDGPTSRSSIGIVEHPATRSSNFHRFASATIAMSRPKTAEATRGARRACVGRTPWSGPNPVLRRRCPRPPPSGSRCCRRCCPASSRYARHSDNASSRTRGRDRSPRACSAHRGGRARTDRHTIPTRSRSCCAARTRWPGRRRRARYRRSRPRRCYGRGTALEHVHPVFATRGQVVAPGVARPDQPPARRLLPLRLTRQRQPGPRPERNPVPFINHDVIP